MRGKSPNSRNVGSTVSVGDHVVSTFNHGCFEGDGQVRSCELPRGFEVESAVLIWDPQNYAADEDDGDEEMGDGDDDDDDDEAFDDAYALC